MESSTACIQKQRRCGSHLEITTPFSVDEPSGAPQTLPPSVARHQQITAALTSPIAELGSRRGSETREKQTPVSMNEVRFEVGWNLLLVEYSAPLRELGLT